MAEKLKLVLVEKLRAGDEIFNDERGYTRAYGILLVKRVESLSPNQVLVMVGYSKESALWSLIFRRHERVVVSEIQPRKGTVATIVSAL